MDMDLLLKMAERYGIEVRDVPDDEVGGVFVMKNGEKINLGELKESELFDLLFTVEGNQFG